MRWIIAHPCKICSLLPNATSVEVTRKSTSALESDAQSAIHVYAVLENQLFDAVGVAAEAAGLDELELASVLAELAAGAELSDDLDASPPDLASLLLLADAGFAEE